MSLRSVPRLVIAGATSDSGKTAITCGLAGALRSRGLAVQTFKVGPAISDAGDLAQASGRPCRNLDSWLLGRERVVSAFVDGVADADFAIIEGAKAIFDSYAGSHSPESGGYRFPGSTAEIAQLLGAPLLLVIDVAHCGQTSAAVALGTKQLDPGTNFCGVILNNAGDEHLRNAIEDAIWEWAKVPVLGTLSHLNHLISPAWNLELLTAAVSRHCNLDLICRLAANVKELPEVKGVRQSATARARIGLAFDDAFSSYYVENLELLERNGAEIVPLSPLEDRTLPPGLDGLYLGDGLKPEHLPRLVRNAGFMAAVKRAHLQEMPIYAEGSGSMFCVEAIRFGDSRLQLANLVAAEIELLPASGCGNRLLQTATDSMVAAAGSALRGHQVTYSRVISSPDLQHAYALHSPDGEPLGYEGWSSGNLLISSVRLHFGQDPGIATRFVAQAQAWSRVKDRARALMV